MTLTLEQYSKKHNYRILHVYTTIGDERGSHTRAIVEDRQSSEQYYLYYDNSHRRRKRCTICKQTSQPHYQSGDCLGIFYTERGWRNITKDNQRKKLKANDR